jgi:hypothetical protein
MKKLKRRNVVIGLIVITTAYVAIYQNCTGTHERSADFSISTAQVETYIQDLQCTPSGNSSTDAAVSSLNTIEQTSGSEIFYAEAPSSMGDIDVVAPLQYPTLRPDNGGTPAQIYAFFALSSSGTASLVIGLTDPTNAISTTTTTTSTSSSSACSSNALGLTATGTIAAQNDGTNSNLESVTWGDGTFEMGLSLGSMQLVIRSYDVQDGDLQSNIQLEVNEIDQTSGQEIYLGDINLTQPD